MMSVSLPSAVTWIRVPMWSSCTNGYSLFWARLFVARYIRSEYPLYASRKLLACRRRSIPWYPIIDDNIYQKLCCRCSPFGCPRASGWQLKATGRSPTCSLHINWWMLTLHCLRSGPLRPSLDVGGGVCHLRVTRNQTQSRRSTSTANVPGWCYLQPGSCLVCIGVASRQNSETPP